MTKADISVHTFGKDDISVLNISKKTKNNLYYLGFYTIDDILNAIYPPHRNLHKLTNMMSNRLIKKIEDDIRKYKE